MKTIDNIQGPCVATIGFFDGVHRGHQFVLKQVADEARSSGRKSVVVTFDRHPREVLRGDAPSEVPASECRLLTPLDIKLHLLKATGVDHCVVLPFDMNLASLSAREFMSDILRDQLHADVLVIGYDNRFGRNRADGFDDYVRYGRELGIRVVKSRECEVPEDFEGLHVSSSTIRHLLKQGDIRQANWCLGRRYEIRGMVSHGYAEGRRLGFPTANLQAESIGQLIPATGVYAVEVGVGEGGVRYAGMLNIGTRPTYDGHELTLETHIFDFDDDIYGQRLTLDFVDRIRDERRFESPDELRLQLEVDKSRVKALLENKEYNNESLK